LTDSETDEEFVPRKKRVNKKKDYFTGGQTTSESEDEGGSHVKYTDPKMAFAARAKQGVLNKENWKKYFKQADQIFKFGKASIVLMRLGHEGDVFRLYLKVIYQSQCIICIFCVQSLM